MKQNILELESISQMNKLLGIDPPQHPLIYIMELDKQQAPAHLTNIPVHSPFYVVALKDADCGVQYGRNQYDFEEGVLSFFGPDQVVTTTEESNNAKGWMLFFHPDLIRKSELGKHIDDYHFFSYDVHEALHLSKNEEDILNDCVNKIQYELNQNIDSHSQRLLISNIELLLNYCNRFYERQFHTRSDHHKDIISQIDHVIKDYYKENHQLEIGALTVPLLADKVSLSPNYLSDLLRKETGRNAKEHIHRHVIHLAKNKLLNSRDSISEIAYDLGFNYPHYFSRLFKKQTGMTPHDYRSHLPN